jgi:hypothetical protein
MRPKGEAMKRYVISALLAATLALVVAGPAAADPPIEISVADTFVDIDPCTRQLQEVTIAVTFFVHFHDGVTVARGVRTVTTTGGSVGRGTSSFVLNGNVEVFRFTDLLADDSGNRTRASGLFVVDVASGSIRVDKFSLTCLGS